MKDCCCKSLIILSVHIIFLMCKEPIKHEEVDTTPPKIEIIPPSPGQNFNGTSFVVKAKATDESGIFKVIFYDDDGGYSWNSYVDYSEPWEVTFTASHRENLTSYVYIIAIAYDNHDNIAADTIGVWYGPSPP